MGALGLIAGYVAFAGVVMLAFTSFDSREVPEWLDWLTMIALAPMLAGLLIVSLPFLSPPTLEA